MKKIVTLLFFAFVLFAQTGVRTEIQIPDIAGYKTLKCDFHTHTVFSDGNVWPTMRVAEAWRDGLDAVAITDHLEYRPHKDDITTDHNRSYEITAGVAKDAGVILIQGAEITRSMPPGHMNAIFIQDANALAVDEWQDAVKVAAEQGAFLFYNHPGWKAQQPDGIGKWYDEHEELYQKGWLQGCEVVNENEYYPEVLQWCLDKNMTLLGNSDVHAPIDFAWDKTIEHRPMTLVFATEQTAKGIRDALEARRTAVYYKDQLFGKAEFLQPIFNESVQIKNPVNSFEGKNYFFQVNNQSEIDFKLTLVKQSTGINAVSKITLYAGKTVRLRVSKTDDFDGAPIVLTYKVENMITAPEQPLEVEFNFDGVKDKH